MGKTIFSIFAVQIGDSNFLLFGLFCLPHSSRCKFSIFISRLLAYNVLELRAKKQFMWYMWCSTRWYNWNAIKVSDSMFTLNKYTGPWIIAFYWVCCTIFLNIFNYYKKISLTNIYSDSCPFFVSNALKNVCVYDFWFCVHYNARHFQIPWQQTHTYFKYFTGFPRHVQPHKTTREKKINRTTHSLCCVNDHFGLTHISVQFSVMDIRSTL